MIDYIEKARVGRITALSLHTNGHVMFFPEEYSEGGVENREGRSAVQVSKPMFLRSSAFVAGDLIAAETVANDSEQAYVLSEDAIVGEVMRRAA